MSTFTCAFRRRLSHLIACVNSSRLTYVVLVDAALTFLLVTAIFHHHLSLFTQARSLSLLCRTFLDTLASLPILSPLSPGVDYSVLAPPAQEICRTAEINLVNAGSSSAPAAWLTRLLLVTPDYLALRSDVSFDDELSRSSAQLYEHVRSERNWRVGTFVLVKAVGLVLWSTWMSGAEPSMRPRKTTHLGSRLKAISIERFGFGTRQETGNEKRRDGLGHSSPSAATPSHVEIHIIPSTPDLSACASPATPCLTPHGNVGSREREGQRQAFLTVSDLDECGAADDVEEVEHLDGREEGDDDVPWLTLAASLLLHLVVLLVDLDAFNISPLPPSSPSFRPTAGAPTHAMSSLPLAAPFSNQTIVGLFAIGGLVLVGFAKGVQASWAPASTVAAPVRPDQGVHGEEKKAVYLSLPFDAAE
ncbi:hypothetical protein JCM10212_006407 [Sporobolomyces blumeae]